MLEALTHVLKHLDSERMAQFDQVPGEYTAECQHRLTVQWQPAHPSLGVQHCFVLHALKEATHDVGAGSTATLDLNCGALPGVFEQDVQRVSGIERSFGLARAETLPETDPAGILSDCVLQSAMFGAFTPRRPPAPPRTPEGVGVQKWVGAQEPPARGSSLGR